MSLKKEKQQLKRRIHRVRKNISGTAEVPRLSVFRSLNHIYVQLIDDVNGKTLAAVSTKSKDLADDLAKAKNKTEQSFKVGEQISNKAKELKIEKAVFDRGPYRFHGRVKAVADGAKKAGLVI